VFVQLLGDPNLRFSAGNVFSPSGRDLLPAASDDEIRKAYGGYYAYFGTYEIDERQAAGYASRGVKLAASRDRFEIRASV